MRGKKFWQIFGEGSFYTGWVETAKASDAEAKANH
jgi:hypothetical protein